MTIYREVTYITMTMYKAGEHPWTLDKFYLHAVPQEEAPHTTDPIVYTGPFGEKWTAESNEWWHDEHGLWIGDPNQLDNQFKLTSDIIGIDIEPLHIGVDDKNNPGNTLLEYECYNMSVSDAFDDYRHEIVKLLRTQIQPAPDDCENTKVSALVLWKCESGQDWDGEWYSNYEIIGILNLDSTITQLEKEDTP